MLKELILNLSWNFQQITTTKKSCKYTMHSLLIDFLWSIYDVSWEILRKSFPYKHRISDKVFSLMHFNLCLSLLLKWCGWYENSIIFQYRCRLKARESKKFTFLLPWGEIAEAVSEKENKEFALYGVKSTLRRAYNPMRFCIEEAFTDKVRRHKDNGEKNSLILMRKSTW